MLTGEVPRHLRSALLARNGWWASYTLLPQTPLWLVHECSPNSDPDCLLISIMLHTGAAKLSFHLLKKVSEPGKASTFTSLPREEPYKSKK